MPGKSLREQLAQNVPRGAIYHVFSSIAGKGKYIVILNRKWPPAEGMTVVYAFLTSKVTRFAYGRVPESQIVRLEPGDYVCCDVTTVLDLTDLHEMLMQQLLEARMFSYVDQLSQTHLSAVDAAVRTSTRVSVRHRRMIVGPD